MFRGTLNTIQDENEEEWKISLNNEKFHATEFKKFC